MYICQLKVACVIGNHMDLSAIWKQGIYMSKVSGNLSCKCDSQIILKSTYPPVSIATFTSDDKVDPSKPHPEALSKM